MTLRCRRKEAKTERPGAGRKGVSVHREAWAWEGWLWWVWGPECGSGCGEEEKSIVGPSRQREVGGCGWEVGGGPFRPKTLGIGKCW